MMKTIEVVAAIIRRGDKVFATQRGYGDWKDWWEFPGGKMEPGESPQEALIREIREELDAEISVDKFLYTVDWDYPKFHLTMHCFMASLQKDALHLNEHEAAKWLGKKDIYSVKWLPADEILLPMIVAELTRLETNRFVLRPWRDDDAAVLYKWASDPEVGPRAGWPPHRSVDESLRIIRTVFHNDSNWAIEFKETGEAIGAIGYGPACECKLPAREGEALVGYWIARPYWNRGICTGALARMIEYIRKNTDIKSLISGHFVDNPASGRVMEKCGFVPTGETVIDETQYQGAGRPIRVLRLELTDQDSDALLR